ncbi:MAG: hypothetical protein FWD31_04805 [Planctomycetaceae bacterium]|nr:hypothetical protein [Planctomycetaceae bacterium]
MEIKIVPDVILPANRVIKAIIQLLRARSTCRIRLPRTYLLQPAVGAINPQGGFVVTSPEIEPANNIQ